MVNVNPCRSANAIRMVGFLLDFERPFSSGAIEVAESLHEGETDLLPGLDPLETISLPLGGVVFGTVNPKKKGFVAKRVSKSGEIAFSFEVAENTVLIRCSEYSRWIEVFENQVMGQLEKYMTALSEANVLRSVLLEYRDEFEVINPESDWKGDLFNQNSNLVAPVIFDQSDLWHSHVGYFSFDKGTGNRVLTKLNIDYLNAQKKKKIVQCVSSHKIEVEVPQSGDEFLTTVSKIFERLHEENKGLMRNLLCNKMKTRIKLQ